MNALVPPRLYHGTAIDADAMLIFFQDGIRGRLVGEEPTHHGRPSVPSIVYLTEVFAVWYGALARHERHRDLIVAFEIDTNQLNAALLRPDEDFLDWMARRGDPRVKHHRVRTDNEASKHGINLDPRAYASLWNDSNTEFGSLGYDGVIPPSGDFARSRA